MSFQFWRRWLIVVCCGVMIYSTGLILLPDAMQQLFRILFFTSSDSTLPFAAEAAVYIVLVQGVLGAVLIGWMSTFLIILLTTFRPGRQGVWVSIAFPAAIWFAIDSGFSLFVGVPVHALFNVVFFVLLVIPLIAVYPYFWNKTGSVWQQKRS